MEDKRLQPVVKVIETYFEGLYEGNTEKLRFCFTEEAVLYGDIAGAEYKKSLNEYLEGVANRKSPEELGEEFQMEIVGLEVLGKTATAKLKVPMLGFNYVDFISLFKQNNAWKMVNKLFVHVA